MTRSISHEIRTPLNTAFMALDLMISTLTASSDSYSSEPTLTRSPDFKGCNIPEAERTNLLEIAGSIREGCDISLNILNQLLTFEKLSANMMKLELKLVSIGQIIEHNVLLFKMQAQQRGIRFMVEGLSTGVLSSRSNPFNEEKRSGRKSNQVSKSGSGSGKIHGGGFMLPTSFKPDPVAAGTPRTGGRSSSSVNDLQVFVDEHKLNQVIRNLLSNAMKFTPKHGVVIIKVHWHNPLGVSLGEVDANSANQQPLNHGANNVGIGSTAVELVRRYTGNTGKCQTNKPQNQEGQNDLENGNKETSMVGNNTVQKVENENNHDTSITSCCGRWNAWMNNSSLQSSSYLQSNSFLSSQLMQSNIQSEMKARANSMTSISNWYTALNNFHNNNANNAIDQTGSSGEQSKLPSPKLGSFLNATTDSTPAASNTISSITSRVNRYLKQVQENNPVLDIMHHELAHAKAAGSLVISIVDSGPGVSEVSVVHVSN
jgi:hypothetical protein